jgi:GT2 family glycosyltransferase
MNAVAVVIPNWNGEHLLPSCLDSLKEQSQTHEVVVVDNGSTDGSVKMLQKDYPWVHLIELPTNTGFTGGVNAGIKYALKQKFEYVALFNDDAVAEKNWLKNLLNTARNNPKAGIVTCKLLRIDKKHIDSTGDFYTVWGLPFPRGRNEVDTGQYDTKTQIFSASGGASLYRSALFDDIGLFDDDFFLYFEDVDISFRAQLSGWSVMYEPSAVAYHHVSATSSKIGDVARYHSAKNFLLLYAKNMPKKLYFKYAPLFVLQFLRMAASSLYRGKFVVFTKGTFAAFKLHSSTVQKRRSIQRRRSASIEYIDSMLVHASPKKAPLLEKSV